MICPHCHLEDLGGLHGPDYCVEVLAEVIERLPITGMIRPRGPVDHDAYRRGLCCDCSTARHSAGRPRCAPCHAALTSGLPDMTPQRDRNQLGVCSQPGCSKPTVPGRVLCGPHYREIKENR